MRGYGYDAVVLSGGRGSRLGGVVKARLLSRAGATVVPLLRRAVSAAEGARRIVVVGDGVAGLPSTVHLVRENPAFGGPVAALDAGVQELEREGRQEEFVLVLACDMPEIGQAVDGLLAAAASDPRHDGVLAIDAAGRAQYLAAVYRYTALRGALASARELGVDGMSMRALLHGLQLGDCPVPLGTTDDVDDWDDAVRMGVTAPSAPENREDQT